MPVYLLHSKLHEGRTVSDLFTIVSLMPDMH